jgi:hypothetical protein
VFSLCVCVWYEESLPESCEYVPGRRSVREGLYSGEGRDRAFSALDLTVVAMAHGHGWPCDHVRVQAHAMYVDAY